MPRVNHVKKAQQRYATKPVLDPTTGEQKSVPVMDKRTGQAKVTKSGRPIKLRRSERDLEHPLPMPQCDYRQCKEASPEIAVGSPYKWLKPSGQSTRSRHAGCPSWNVWEYSSSLSARIAEIQSEEPEVYHLLEDAEAWASGKADEIRDLAEEKLESAQNIVDGFGHETYQSEELEGIATDLECWADDMENVDLPEMPEHEHEEDDEEHGEEDYEERMSTWRDEIHEALRNALDESPV